MPLESNNCPNGWVQIGHLCYYFSKVKATWSKARSSCRNLNGDLVVPTNTIVSKAIGKVAKEKKMASPWIGLTRHQDKKFYTIFGSKPSYTNWQPGEPNNGGGSEDCAHLGNEHGQWNDVSCGTLLHFICQKHKCKLIYIFTPTFSFISNGNLIILEVLRIAYFFMATMNMINGMTRIAEFRIILLTFIFTSTFACIRNGNSIPNIYFYFLLKFSF